eukprot:2188712-Heterocapsa_arctica.AAC.1
MDCLIGGGTGLYLNWENNELVSNVLGSGGKAITTKEKEVRVSMSSCTKILSAIVDVTSDRTTDWAFKLEAASSTNRQLGAMFGKAGW